MGRHFVSELSSVIHHALIGVQPLYALERIYRDEYVTNISLNRFCEKVKRGVVSENVDNIFVVALVQIVKNAII